MIVGRKEEQRLLSKAFKSTEAEFITIYGRRRVGKTYLVREFFNQKSCTFLHITGIQNGSLELQLRKFSEAFSATFLNDTPIEVPKNWGDAFALLQKQIFKMKGKIVIFLDELPWLASKKSGLLEELDYFWNRHWSGMRNVILIACGSSASWLIKKIIYNKGGLHNRTTIRIRLLPFNLFEADQYLKSKKIKLNQNHTLKIYLALGGIPYYLRYVEPGLTAEQNIQRIIFDDNAPLKNEYTLLFNSLFENAETYKEIVKLISFKKEGIERTELANLEKSSKNGGRLSQKLDDLVATGFIKKFIPWGKTRGEYYKIIDEYILFFLHRVADEDKQFPQDYWLTQSQRPAYLAWSGYAFEAVCMKHIHQIVKALALPAKEMGSWRYVPKNTDDSGAQIDLVIDRWDNAINLCEIKYTEHPFIFDKKCAEKLKKIVELFRKNARIDKQIFLSLVSANGVKESMYLEEMINGIVTLHDLYKEI